MLLASTLDEYVVLSIVEKWATYYPGMKNVIEGCRRKDREWRGATRQAGRVLCCGPKTRSANPTPLITRSVPLITLCPFKISAAQGSECHSHPNFAAQYIGKPFHQFDRKWKPKSSQQLFVQVSQVCSKHKCVLLTGKRLPQPNNSSTSFKLLPG